MGTTDNLGLEEYLARDIPDKERRMLRDNKRRLAHKHRILQRIYQLDPVDPKYCALYTLCQVLDIPHKKFRKRILSRINLDFRRRL